MTIQSNEIGPKAALFLKIRAAEIRYNLYYSNTAVISELQLLSSTLQFKSRGRFLITTNNVQLNYQ